MSQSTPTEISTGERIEPVLVLGEKYRVARLLGEGGMGAVYEAENTWTRRRVAIKVMRPEFVRDAESVQRFMREAQSAAQVDHPNVVSVLDLGRDEPTGSLFIVQEFLDGKELRSVLRERGAMPQEQALEIILPVIDGLVAAHALGVVHRDLKPENIFLVQSRTGRTVPKLIDFGIAKALRPREREFQTIVGQVMGTPGYMSPEQARGELDIDARTDIWAIGVVLYELLAGRIPYDSAATPQAMVVKMLTENPLPLELTAPTVAPELRAVVARALQRDREDRYPDMAAFYDALAATDLGGRVRDTLRKKRVESTAIAAVSVPETPSAPVFPSTLRDAAPPSALPLGVILAASLTLVALALAAVFALRSPLPPPPSRPPRAASLPTLSATPVTPPSAGSRAHADPPHVDPPALPPAVAPRPPVVTTEPARPTRPRPHHTDASQRGANGSLIIE